MARQYWNAFTARNRPDAIARIRDEINQVGCILSFTQFSDVALALTAEIPANAIGHLHATLIGWMKMEPETVAVTTAPGDVMVFLHVTFTRGTGMQQREIPPG